MNMIEPCCAERQVCRLLRENKEHAAVFQTNGDMTLAKWMQAVMLLSGNRPRTLTLAVPIFTEKMMATVGKYMQLEWVARLRLMTTDTMPIETLQRFAAKTGCELDALLQRTELAADTAVPDGLMMFAGTDGTVILQGAMFDTITPRLCLYAGIFGRTAVREVADVWNARFKARRYEAAATIGKTADSKPAVAKKKTRTRKIKKANDEPTEKMA